MTAVVLISTTNVGGGRLEPLRRLLDSVGREIANLPGVRCTHLLLLQGYDDLERFRPDLPSFVSAETVSTNVSLSAARNILLRSLAMRSAASPDDIVGFPDDDCWYPNGSLAFIVNQFMENQDLDFWFCRYASDPKSFDANAVSVSASAHQVVQHASSNTIFVRRRVLEKIGTFDEDLGVGTANLGGEDLAFALGAYASARASRFCDLAGIGHRDKIESLSARYYPGSLLALARHAGLGGRILSQYFRKIGVGMYLVFKRQLPVGAFMRANLAALKDLGRARRR
jgi:hypothetical protein